MEPEEKELHELQHRLALRHDLNDYQQVVQLGGSTVACRADEPILHRPDQKQIEEVRREGLQMFRIIADDACTAAVEL